MEITSNVIGKKVFSVECSDQLKPTFLGIKAPSVSSDIQSVRWNYETKAAARFIDRRNYLKCTCARAIKIGRIVKTSFISAVSVLLDICMRGFSLTVLKIMTHKIGYDHNTPLNKLKQVMVGEVNMTTKQQNSYVD